MTGLVVTIDLLH